MRRREKFIISAILLSLGLLAVQYIALQYRFLAVFVFFAASYLVSAWALFEDLYGVEWVTIVPFPAMYALSVSFFYFLLPDNWISRVLILVLFGVGMYALYLTCNIFSVAKARTIQLLRAAQAIGFLFILLISTLFANTIFSFHFPFWTNAGLLLASHLPLYLHLLWSAKIQSTIDPKLRWLVILFSLMLAEVGLIVSLFPVGIWTASLLVSSFMYVSGGIVQSSLQERLFQNTIWEYVTFGGFVMLSFLFLLEWK